MGTLSKKATIYLQPEIHLALRLKAADLEKSMSDLVNEAIRLSLAEDADDLAACAERASEPDLVFEHVLQDLKRRGTI